VSRAARSYGVTAPTVRKWLGRYLAHGEGGLADASSRPEHSPRAIDSDPASISRTSEVGNVLMNGETT